MSKDSIEQSRDFYETLEERFGRRGFCVRCADKRVAAQGEERYSMGVYAGRYCNHCWSEDGRNHDRAFDPDDAGERMDEEDP